MGSTPIQGDPSTAGDRGRWLRIQDLLLAVGVLVAAATLIYRSGYPWQTPPPWSDIAVVALSFGSAGGMLPLLSKLRREDWSLLPESVLSIAILGAASGVLAALVAEPLTRFFGAGFQADIALAYVVAGWIGTATFGRPGVSPRFKDRWDRSVEEFRAGPGNTVPVEERRVLVATESAADIAEGMNEILAPSAVVSASGGSTSLPAAVTTLAFLAFLAAEALPGGLTGIQGAVLGFGIGLTVLVVLAVAALYSSRHSAAVRRTTQSASLE